VLDRLRKRYLKEQFQPGWLAVFINPFYFARRGLFRHVAELGIHITGKTVDVGCGQKPYEHLCRASSYIGLELDTPENRARKKADVFYTGESFPFLEKEFDSIICNQVLEHVFTPDSFLKELGRILKPGGMLLLTVPFVWDEHEQPADYARYSSFGIASILERSGFEVIAARKSVDDVRAIVQLVNGYLYKKTLSSNRLLNIAATVFLMTPFNILGSVLGMLLPRNSDLYLDNIILARKKHRA
jgi:SAM-dependent methyltransferase